MAARGAVAVAAIKRVVKPQTFTQSEIDSVIGSLVNCIKSSGDTYYSGKVFGYSTCAYFPLMVKFIHAYYVLTNWSQSPNGDTSGYTNSISQTQLTATMIWSKKNCNC